MASVGLRAQDAEEHEHEHTVPLLANAAQEGKYTLTGCMEHLTHRTPFRNPTFNV